VSPLAPAPVQTVWPQAPDLTGCTNSAHIAAAFAEDAVVRALDADRAEAVLREPADRSRAVLGLHNPSDGEVRIHLTSLLPEHAEQAWHFVSGSMHTSDAEGGLCVHLAPSAHVWLTAAL
jgi:predicted NAD/FAD-binding protein